MSLNGLNPERILLTGATGFIGSHINKLLEFRCVAGTRDTLCDVINSKQVSLSELLESEDYKKLFGSTSVIIHLANLAHSRNYDPDELKTVNVDNTLELARRAVKSNVKRFVYVSSIAVNGKAKPNTSFNHLSSVCPNTDYARSKHEAELGLFQIAKETGLEVVIVRSALVYGADAPANICSLIKLIKKSPILPFGSVSNKRDFISIQNLSDLLLVCASHPNALNQIFLASDCKPVSIKDFTNAISQSLGKSLIQLPVPVSFMRFTARLLGRSSLAEQLLGDLQIDSSNTQEVLGWVPPCTMEQAMSSLSERIK
ncbi:NAD-dependent epimerase/dehydratase family protein [Shewanella sp. NR704-98]|uniref:NAD-dependent epimerase/dehydratase family protein n=1 Tax=Shewanella nanhaiensis TaxID=2864872 RepID=A0ABS7E6A5_9GAMM|nr:NAD-dependent epimerase/dehydratase family protein [Shewanella nanhaiensis]